jgi:hypothetical protein
MVLYRENALLARFAVPEKIFGLTLILDFFDRCTQTPLAVSATGGARAFGPKQALYQTEPCPDIIN